MTMGRFEDLTGKRFGKLVVQSRAEKKGRRVCWNCICDCNPDIVKSIMGQNLKDSSTSSCGCEKKMVYNDVDKRIYSILRGMKERCSNPNHSHYIHYGGKGISVCEEWKDFSKFKDWALNNGYSYELTIDRIDVNGNYEPSNCRWATQKEQSSNKTNNSLITLNGETKTLQEWSDISGIHEETIASRIKSGWEDSRILSKGRCKTDTREKVSKWEVKNSGVKGIGWNNRKQKWFVRVRVEGKTKQIGQYRELDLAIQRMEEYKKEMIIGDE